MENYLELSDSRFNIDLQWFGGAGAPVLVGSRIGDNVITWQVIEDADIIDWDKVNDFIYAIGITTTSGKKLNSTDFRIEWENTTDSPGTWNILGSTGELTYNGATSLVDGNTVATTGIDYTGFTYDSTKSKESEGTNAVNIDLSSGDATELQFAIDSSSALDGKQYSFRLYNVTDGAVVTGTCASQITMATGGVQTHQLAGSTDSVSLLSGAINVLRLIIGSTDSVSLLTGTLGVLRLLSGTIDSISLLSGSIDAVVKHQLAGSTDSVSILGSNIDVIRSLISTIDSISLLSGTINRVVDISGSIESISFLLSNIDLIKDIKGSIDSISLLSGNLSITGGGVIVSLQGTIDSVSLLFGLFNINIPINGTIDSISLLSGNIDLIKDIKGSIDSISLLSGNLIIIDGENAPPINLQGPIIGLFGGPVVSWR